jgi:ornithine cyclodeaminase
MLTRDDADVLRVSSSDAVGIMRNALRAHHEGGLEAPTRFSVKLGAGGFTFTAGRLAGTASGFRLGTSMEGAHRELTLVFDGDGVPVGVVHGSNIGRRRTGALGGVAADACARPDATTIGFVGAGEQAFTQLWAIASVRSLQRVRVYSRDPERRALFAARAAAELGLAVETLSEVESAVVDTDIVVLSPPAADPLIDPGWVSPGTHVHTLGPKGVTLDPSGGAEGECPRALVKSADLLFSDSPAQLEAMEGPAHPWTEGRPAIALGSIVAGALPGRVTPDDVTCYASVGLAGTEVLLARRVLELEPLEL